MHRPGRLQVRARTGLLELGPLLLPLRLLPRRMQGRESAMPAGEGLPEGVGAGSEGTSDQLLPL